MDMQQRYENLLSDNKRLITEIDRLRQQLASQPSLRMHELNLSTEDKNAIRKGISDSVVITAPSVDFLVEAAKQLIANKQSSYKARNGKEVHLQGDDGERMWISSSDDVLVLEHALATYSNPITVKED